MYDDKWRAAAAAGCCLCCHLYGRAPGYKSGRTIGATADLVCMEIGVCTGLEKEEEEFTFLIDHNMISPVLEEPCEELEGGAQHRKCTTHLPTSSSMGAT